MFTKLVKSIMCRLMLSGLSVVFFNQIFAFQSEKLVLNDQEYFEMPGLNVMVFHDYYPEGHQTGVTIIQNGVRVAANGDVRLEPTPGQWQPVPKVGVRSVDRENNSVSVACWFPDSSKNRKGFNPVIYPELLLNYAVRVKAEGASVRVMVDLEKPLPKEWVGRVGFNFELFPGEFFGRSWNLDGTTGIFPNQLNGPMKKDAWGELQVAPMASGKKLVVAPESPAHLLTIESKKEPLALIDGRALHNNGWFVVRSLIPANQTTAAVEWVITPNALPDWRYDPVVHVSQVGYHPQQKKIAVVETDPLDDDLKTVILERVEASGTRTVVKESKPEKWGTFTRYNYYQLDFSDVTEDGMYMVSYGDFETQPFQISERVFERHVWQPTLEYFLPVQMCHMRINDRYRVWHGLCHLDDAQMAPVDSNHFDGYKQGESTLTAFKSGEVVPELNVGGWHDAGDYDLRVESQAGTVRILSWIYEEFAVEWDETSVDQKNRIVEIHRPDGKPDVLQQIEHGVMTILAGYRQLGRLYRGIICRDLRQYTLLGDGSTMTDNVIGNDDDRWVFTEENPWRELGVAAGLAAASRVLKAYDSALATECYEVARKITDQHPGDGRLAMAKVPAVVELFLATQETKDRAWLLENIEAIEQGIGRAGSDVGRVLRTIGDKNFVERVNAAMKTHYAGIEKGTRENPFGVPYRPDIWGAGWNVQRFGVDQYFLHKSFPEIVPADHMLSALNFVLGCHPGRNTASFASGVGSKSLLVAYGVNRGDWSHIPGGVGSGTAFIRPDFPELKTWPFFWQQTEYVMGGGGSNFMFLALAARDVLKEK